jgi:hypothetical protein
MVIKPLAKPAVDALAATVPATSHTEPQPETLPTAIAPPRRGRGLVVAVLILLAAAGTAAVVYFALPYFT